MNLSPNYPRLSASPTGLLLACRDDQHASGIGSENLNWRWRPVATSATDGPEAPASVSRNIRDRKMARLEAVLLVADGAFTFRRLAQLATLADAAEARALVDRLNESYDGGHSAFRIERVANGCRMMTRPQFSRWIDRLHNRQALVKLSSAMMETLSIVAYRQPVTRAEIEKIRGVQSAEMLKQLMERSYVRITGEDDSLGRPFLYGTTRQFLESFGLKDLNSMPMSESLRRVIKEEEPGPAIAPEDVEESDVDEVDADTEGVETNVDEASADDENEWDEEAA